MSNNFSADHDLHNLIIKEIRELHLADHAIYERIHTKIRMADKFGEISRINRVFVSSLAPNRQRNIPAQKQIYNLDKANIYTWLAYSLYDQVLDTADNRALPVANILLRSAITTYRATGVSEDLIHAIFREVDDANSLELILREKYQKNHMLPPDDFEPLMANKSIAHCLGQIWIMYQHDELNISNTLSGFYDYCAARQLCDDLYDWRDDYRQGHHTYVTAYLIKVADLSKPTTQSQDFKRLNTMYADNGLEYLCNQVISTARRSILAFDTILKQHSAYTQQYIVPLIVSAEQSIKSLKAQMTSV